MSQVPVLLLPAELQTEILGSLDPKTLKACMITCRQLHKLICDVSSLQYKITLPSTGMNDGPDRTLPAAAERLDRLRMHRDAWRELDWNEAAPWAIPSPYRVGISSGIFVAFFPEESKLILRRPPSSLRNVARLDWELKLPCVPYDICIDASQDLLAVVDVVGRVHLLSLLQERGHPEASPEVNFPSDMHSGSMRIFGDFLGLYNGIYQNWCTIKNWKTGETVLRSKNFGNFCFLDDKHVLTISDKYYWAVHIYEYPVKNTCEEGISTDPALALFLLPPVSPNSHILYSLHDSGPDTDRSEGYFHNDRAEKMVYIRVSFWEDSPGVGRRVSQATDETVFAIPMRFFLPYLNRKRKEGHDGAIVLHVNWEEWGPAHTLAFGGPPGWFAFAAASNAIHGTRCAMVNKEVAPATIEVLDFHPARVAAARRELGKSPDHASAAFTVRAQGWLDATAHGWEVSGFPSEMDRRNLWGWGPVDPALTELPCVVSRRALPDTLDGNGGSVLLTEDAILYVPPADLAAGSGEIRVFEF